MNNWVRILFGIIVLVHGIGHILFLIPALGIADWGQSTRSWLLTKPLGDGVTRGLGAVLWVLVTVGYIVGTFGYFTHAAWWQPTIVAVSAASAVGLILFWASPASSSAIIALIVDLVIILAIEIFHWPST
jgi:hypothetical protein